MNISCTFGTVKEVNKNLHFDFFLGGWTIHYRFWFCVHGTWTMDAYICLWWLQWKFSMRLWLHNYRMYIYALGTQNLNVLKENSSNFICIVLLDTQYTQVTFLVLHVTFFVMGTEYHFVLFSCYIFISFFATFKKEVVAMATFPFHIFYYCHFLWYMSSWYSAIKFEESFSKNKFQKEHWLNKIISEFLVIISFLH